MLSRFSIIIPTKDRQQILEKTFSVLSQTKGYEELEIIIINDSEKELALKNKTNNISIYRNMGSGVAAARNTGAAKAKNDWLIFMDDDMLVGDESFFFLHPFCEHYPDSCLNLNWVYPEAIYTKADKVPFIRYLKHYGFDSLEGWSTDVQWDKTKLFQVKRITSQFLLMQKSTFEMAGRYNTSFPFAGFEDHDFSGRLKDKGIRIYVDPNNMIFHNEFDRIDIESWMQRKKRGGITRRVAVSLGYADVELHYNVLKKIVYSIVYRVKSPLLVILNNWPRSSFWDKFFFAMINLLLGTYSYSGYTSRQALKFIDNLRDSATKNS
jgi:glycosyltransferase involved in cell wall biosynthesis